MEEKNGSGTRVPPLNNAKEKTGETSLPLAAFRPLDRDDLISKRRRALPHWEQSGCSYFVTFRLADSLPMSTLRNLREWKERWLQKQPKPWTERTLRELDMAYSRRIEHWLDSGLDSCCLRAKEHRDIVVRAIEHFEGERYFLDSFVVMPNHVYVLLALNTSISLAKVVHSWKSYSAHQIAQKLSGSEPLWMSEYFDHIVRSPQQLEHFQRYIRDNPSKARLQSDEYSYRTFH
jgi:REP element-mobilizing transposase RayT